MLSPWMLSVVLLAVSASPFTEQRSLNLAEQDETMQAAFEKKEEALEEVELRERALEEQLLETLLEEERLLDTELTGSNTAKFIDSNVEGEKFSFSTTKSCHRHNCSNCKGDAKPFVWFDRVVWRNICCHRRLSSSTIRFSQIDSRYKKNINGSIHGRKWGLKTRTCVALFNLHFLQFLAQNLSNSTFLIKIGFWPNIQLI